MQVYSTLPVLPSSLAPGGVLVGLIHTQALGMGETEVTTADRVPAMCLELIQESVSLSRGRKFGQNGENHGRLSRKVYVVI